MKINKHFSSRLLTIGLSIGVVVGGLVSCQEKSSSEPELENLTQYVDPYIGTGDHGHVFVGANVPFGAIQLGPSNITQGWDWCSGYHISDSTILGFAHTHLSGTGIGDLGDISFMPLTGDVVLKRGVHGDQSTGMYSLFDRNTEKVKAGYYAVHLDRYDVDVELTATKRVGFHKYTFNDKSKSDPRVVINLEAGIGWDTPLEGYMIQENDSVISGYRHSKGWAKNQKVYFTAIFSEPIKKFVVSDSTAIVDGKEIGKVRRAHGQAYFAPSEGKKEIYVKVSLSPISIDGAKANMKAELAGWDFEQTIKDADLAWNQELNKINIKTSDVAAKRTFYTALYHSMFAPSVLNDVDGTYLGSDQKPYPNAGFQNYTTFSLWDTYRAAHPLMTIIHPEKMPDMVNTMLHIYKYQGKLPVWHLMGNETDCMVGNPGIPVVADAYLKGFSGFDKDLAFEAMKASAMADDRGLKEYRELGYVPSEIVESVAMGMEYALADWALAQVAKERGAKDDYDYFLKRSNSYEHYFDKNLNFVRGKDAKGNFRNEIFDPFKTEHRADDYTEGNAWQYTWLVPQNVKGLVDLFGSEDKFIAKLDSLFTISSELTGADASPDISGLIGQYAHGNEPSHHILYIYPYVGQPWKTAEKVREVLTTLYTDKPAGLSGNEDVGQMSSWYILSSLGFYQVAPAGGVYVFGSPLFDEATIKVGAGKTFTVAAKNNSSANIYIQSATLNGQPYSKSYIDFKDIQAGGKLEFEMGSTPSETFGVKAEDRPLSIQ